MFITAGTLRHDGKIIGGTDAGTNEFPHHVSLSFTWFEEYDSVLWCWIHFVTLSHIVTSITISTERCILWKIVNQNLHLANTKEDNETEEQASSFFTITMYHTSGKELKEHNPCYLLEKQYIFNALMIINVRHDNCFLRNNEIEGFKWKRLRFFKVLLRFRHLKPV